MPTSLAVFWGEDMSGARRRRAERGVSADEDVATKAPPRATARGAGRRIRQADRPTSASGRRRGATSTASSASPATSSSRSTTRARASRCGFTSAQWGSLASFGARAYPGTKKWYGTSGNSFVAVVEFGDSVRARAVTAGGESGHPESPHFNDQAPAYATGDLREVYFYPVAAQGAHGARVPPRRAERD